MTSLNLLTKTLTQEADVNVHTKNGINKEPTIGSTIPSFG